MKRFFSGRKRNPKRPVEGTPTPFSSGKNRFLGGMRLNVQLF